MNRNSFQRTVALAAAILLPILAACSGQTPEERVSELRSRYSAELNAFYRQKPPPPPAAEEPVEGEEGAAEPAEPASGDEPAAGEGAEGAVMAEPVAEPPTADVVLDVLVWHDNNERLPGITVDVTHVDANQQTKGSWRVYFDTSQVPKANKTPYTHVLEGVDYVEGDGFHAEVRHPVPAEERSAYREFTVVMP